MSIELKDLTGGKVDSNGVFDELMRSIKGHLHEEYDAERITGTDYTQAYISSVQAALNIASQFALALPKTNAEIAIYEQKLITEKAQTSDYVDDDETVLVAGVLGKQKTLYQAQTDGFARDAEQKVLDIMANTWIVRQTTDGADADSAGISNPPILDVVNKARQGIGLGNYEPN